MDKTLRCLVIDDEPIARQVLEEYIAKLPWLSVLASCRNALEAYTVLQTQTAEVLFVDIKMPELTGLQFIKSLEVRPAIIITTAFSEFAIEGFDLGVTDYLLKPISFERFLRAVHRITRQAGSVPEMQTTGETEGKQPFIFFKTEGVFRKVLLQNILYIQAYGNYCRIFTTEEMILVAEKISVIESQLENRYFMRVHKSYIVSLQQVEAVSGNVLRIGKAEIPVSLSYRERLNELLGLR
jgi:DNA-binding LytR/AlgR family response regulator